MNKNCYQPKKGHGKLYVSLMITTKQNSRAEIPKKKKKRDLSKLPLKSHKLNKGRNKGGKVEK